MPENAGVTTVDGVTTYNVRELNAGDTRTVGQMVAKVTGDSRLQNAMMTGEQNVIIMAAVACVMERVPRDLALWCSKLINVYDKYNIDTYIAEERKAVEQDIKDGVNRLPLNTGELRAKMENDIIDEMDGLPVGAYMDIIGELFERESFNDFLVSSSQFGKAISNLSSKFANQPSKRGGGKTKKS